MSKTKLLILFPPKFPAPSSVFSISGTGNFILPGALVWKLESVLTSSSFSHPTSHLSANPFGNTLNVHPGSHHSPLPPLSSRWSRPPYSFVWTVGLPSSMSLALVHFILSQYSQNNHLKIDLYSLKTLTLLRGKFKGFTMIYKALHNLPLATSEFLSHTVPSPRLLQPYWSPCCSSDTSLRAFASTAPSAWIVPS